MNTLVARLGIHEPRCRGNATERRITVLRCKAEARDLMSIPHRQRWHGDYRLAEKAVKESMIAAKGVSVASEHGLHVLHIDLPSCSRRRKLLHD